jgi:hypothetical protein
LTVYSQSFTPDSLRNIEVVRWRLERLIQDAYRLRALEEYVVRLEQETSISNKLITQLDSAVKIKDRIIETHSQESTAWKGRYENQKELTKQEKRGKRRWRVVAIVATGLFVWVGVSP